MRMTSENVVWTIDVFSIQQYCGFFFFICGTCKLWCEPTHFICLMKQRHYSIVSSDFNIFGYSHEMHNSSHSSKYRYEISAKNRCDMHFVLSSRAHTHKHTFPTKIIFDASNATWNYEETYKLISDKCVRYHFPFSNIVNCEEIWSQNSTQKTRCVLEKHE